MLFSFYKLSIVTIRNMPLETCETVENVVKLTPAWKGN